MSLQRTRELLTISAHHQPKALPWGFRRGDYALGGARDRAVQRRLAQRASFLRAGRTMVLAFRGASLGISFAQASEAVARMSAAFRAEEAARKARLRSIATQRGAAGQPVGGR